MTEQIARTVERERSGQADVREIVDQTFDAFSKEGAGALAACWSGAGPTLIGFVTGDAVEGVRAGAGAALAEAGIDGRVLSLSPDRRGLVYGDEAEVPLDGVA